MSLGFKVGVTSNKRHWTKIFYIELLYMQYFFKPNFRAFQSSRRQKTWQPELMILFWFVWDLHDQREILWCVGQWPYFLADLTTLHNELAACQNLWTLWPNSNPIPRSKSMSCQSIIGTETRGSYHSARGSFNMCLLNN